MLFENNKQIKELQNIYKIVNKLSGEMQARAVVKAELQRRITDGRIKLEKAEVSGITGYKDDRDSSNTASEA